MENKEEYFSGRSIYWCAPLISRPSIALFVPLIKIGHLLKANCSVTILIGDLHTQILGDISSSLVQKTSYIKIAIEQMLISIGAPTQKLTFVYSTDLELNKKFMLDFYLIAGSIEIEKVNEAIEGVIKCSSTKSPSLGGLVYPLVRAVDEKYLNVDGQLAPEDHENIFKFADKISSKIEYTNGPRLTYPILKGLSAGKLPVIQEEDDQIDLLDAPKVVKKKLNKAFCEPGNVQDNGVLPIVKHLIFPFFNKFEIMRPADYGGDIKYSKYEEVERDFQEQKLHPSDLKHGVDVNLFELLKPIQKFYEDSKAFQEVAQLAYPLKKDKRPVPVVPIRPPKIEHISISDSAEEELDFAKKLNLVTRNLQEVTQQEFLEKNLRQRRCRIYWGTATTGRPHIAYFVPILKIADFLRAGCEVTILIADLHGYLDSQKAPWDLLDARSKYYESIIISLLKSIGVTIENLKFVKGTEYQLNKDFSCDVFRLISQTNLNDAKRAGSEVVKQKKDPQIGSLLYPLLQALDEEYLDCDAQFGGVDQRKIFMYSEKRLGSIGYTKRCHLMNPMVPGLTGDKMSSSEAGSKIDLLDDEASVRRKIDVALCNTTIGTEKNGILAFIQHVIFPLFGKFILESSQKEYTNHEEITAEFTSGQISEDEIKNSTAIYVNRLLDPIRKDFESSESLELVQRAYPSLQE